ncbi:hypothetical protein A3A03_00835 [Candidatus Nomurabacteria bacterium RIFCSPLOWO2_01_FULL_40_18]|uniref:Uncharacterized protein n=1 Tax=Candidatus Nomurabacteria bacterium RIFCSPLOWO2_01_FULL_40_18 TaxID=1801773 RepID=A0A1F6XI39_9BACT|nr:MAG: hypothetical protein A3A03_00835 [Candidatus Nomurabacteria bacterium RIFCSPLOWO2_01_FULL_40_18]
MGFLVGGLGLVAGLAWNDAVRSLIEHFFPLERNSVLVKFVYAGVITVVVVIFSMYLSRLFIRNDVKDDKEKIDKIK